MLEQRLSRQFEKALKQLQELQDERRKTEDWQMNRAAKLLQMHQERELPYEPKEDGFVFSTDQIAQHIRREERLEEADHARYVRGRAA
jgi:capsule polysaccharide export protein KpsC/LpsZ